MFRINVEKDISFSEKERVVEKIRDTTAVLIAVVKLLPGQEIAKHVTNAKVSILINSGQVRLAFNEKEIFLDRNDFITIDKDKEMCVKNISADTSTFIITKAPNPGTVKV